MPPSTFTLDRNTPFLRGGARRGNFNIDDYTNMFS